jgi:hypothetical protein
MDCKVYYGLSFYILSDDVCFDHVLCQTLPGNIRILSVSGVCFNRLSSLEIGVGRFLDAYLGNNQQKLGIFLWNKNIVVTVTSQADHILLFL